MLDPRKIVRSPQKHSYTFEDSIIKHQIKRHPLDENREVTVINRSTGKQRNYTLQDSILVLDEFTFSVPIKDSNEDLKIYEYREIRKNIMGYDCFKVVITKTDPFFKSLNLFEIEMSSEFKEKYKEFLGPTSTQVLYVTEEIKCKYHPFTNLSEILDHYYPLEITANDGFINGVEKKCTVEELSLE